MKKKVFNVTVFLFCVIIFAACSNEESASNQTNSSVADRFATCKEAAVYHSQGLDFAYNQFKTMNKGERVRMFRNTSNQEKLAFINSSVREFMSQEKIVSKVSVLNKRINLENYEREALNQKILRSSGDIELSPAILKLCSFFDSVVDKVTDISAIKPAIESAIRSEEFASFSEEEQNELLMMLAVYEDSSKYWEENIGDWVEFLGGENSDGVLRSSINTTTTNPAENFDIEEAKISGWKADGAGFLGGAIFGAIKGGIIGAAAGGVGAGPGALAGGLIAGVEGAIASSILNLASLVVVSNSEDDTTFVITNTGVGLSTQVMVTNYLTNSTF
jgi:hypothetical protein